MISRNANLTRLIFIAAMLTWTIGCMGSDPDPKPGASAILSEHGKYRVEVLFEPNPPRAGWNAVELHLFNADGDPVSNVDIVVKPWMTSMNHGTNPATVSLTPGSGNLFTADSVRFSMPGPWDVFVFLSKGNSSDTAKVSVEVK